MKLAEICNGRGINDIFINSIINRKNYTERVLVANYILKQKCEENGFIYIDNDFIGESMLADGLHFNRDGVKVFSENLVKCINDY